MPNPKNFDKLHEAFVADGVTNMTIDEMRDIVGKKGAKGVENRRELYEIARDGGYFSGSYNDFANAYFRPVAPQKAQQMKDKARKNSPVARQQKTAQQPAKPAATPQGQQRKPVQATPNKPDSVVDQFMPQDIPDPTQGNGRQSRVRPQQGTGVLKTDAQIMRDNTLSAGDKATLINENRRRRGQRERNFNDYQEAARDAGINSPNPVEGFTESVEAGFQPDHFTTDSEGNVIDYNPNNYVNKSPVTQYNDRIKEIADEINYYNTKQDQGGGGTTRIEDAINNAYERFVQADQRRMYNGMGGFARSLAAGETQGVSEAIERGSLREKYAGLDAVAEAAYNSFPDEVKQKYGEDAVYSAIYQATLSAMQENARPKNYGEYLAQKLVSTVPAILYKAAVRANAGGRTTLSDIADMETAKYEQELDKQGFVGQVKQGIGTGVSFVADPTMYIPFGGGSGNLVGRGIASVAAKQAVGRGLEAGAVKLASKAAGSKIISRGLVHGVSGGVQMAAYEEALGLANMANGSGQNFWDVTGEALETGAIMVPLGFVSQGARVVKGRTATAIADKGLSRGTQWAANTGAKLGINTTAFIAEAGIFASPDLIKMAVNGTYTNEQARDVVNHSIASLAGIKVAGAFNPTHIEQTMQQVRSVVKGTMGTELALDRHDSEALERLGYPAINGDNIMDLFMPLGDRPEAKNGGGYFSYYSQIVKDERVPWTTRAKLIYVATGMLPETGVRPNSVRKTTDENGRIVVTTLQGNNPISQRFFDKKHSASADSYLRKVSHDVERMNFEGTKQDITNEYLGGIARSQLLNDALAKDPKTRTPEEQKLVDDYNHEVWVATDLMAGYARRTVMYDDKLPDPEKALKKPAWERSEQEQRAVERYGVALNNKLDEIRSNNYSQIALDLADKDSFDATKEMSNKQDGFLYQCQLRGEEGVWYTVVDFDGTIEQGETGMDVTPGANGDKMMVRNMSTGETKMVTLAELTTLSTDRYFDVRNSLTETFYNNYLNSFLESRRKLSFFGKQPQNAEEGERLTLAADDVDPTTGLRPEYTVINKDGRSGTYIVEDAQGNRKLINGHDILQKITDTEQQIPTQIAPQVPPTGPQTPPPAAPTQEPPVQQQGEAPTIPKPGDVFKLKVGDKFVDAEVTGNDDTGIIVRYEDNGMFRTEHLTPEELAPRLEQPEQPAAPVTPPASETNEGEGGTPPILNANIPVDENGKPIYHKAEQKVVEDYFKNVKGYEDRAVMAITDGRIREAQKDLDSAKKKYEKALQTGDEDAIDEAIAAERDAQERLDWWNKFKEGYGKEEQPPVAEPPVAEPPVAEPPVAEPPAAEQPPIAEGQPPVQEGEGEPDVPRDWRDDVPAEARKRGYIMDGAGGKIMRQEPFEEAKGKETKINFGGKTGLVDAKYDIVEAETVQESHINGQENPLHFFIREAQPKERTDKASQKAANATANNIRPEEITSGATAYSGAPVVNTRREVIQGNGRENALHNAYANGKAEGYRQYLIDHAAEWGLDPEAVRKMKKPQLVRVIDVPDERAIELGLMDDKDIGTGGKQYVDPKTLIAKIDTDMFNRLMQAAFEGMKEGDSFADALRQNGKLLIDKLYSKGLINETQMAGLMNADGSLTKAGRETLTEMVLMPLFDGAPANLRAKWDSPAIPERAKTALVKTLARLSRLGDKSVIEDIRKAVALLYEMKDVRDTNTWQKFAHKFNEWGSQVDMQHPEPVGKDYTPDQVRMAGAIKFVLQKKLENFFGEIYRKMYKDPQSLNFDEIGGKPKPEAYKAAFDGIADVITPEEIKDFSTKKPTEPKKETGEGKPATPPTPPESKPQEPQGSGEPPKGEGEPPKPEEPGKPTGEPAGAPAASEPHQLTVDEVNALDLEQDIKEDAIDYINGDKNPRTENAYALALSEWERVNGKSGEGKTETPPATPEDNGPKKPPKGGGGSGKSGRGGGKPAEPKPAEPKPKEPKPADEGPKDSGGIDLSGLSELDGLDGLFSKSDIADSRMSAREGEITKEARYKPLTASKEQNEAVRTVTRVLAGIGKQLLEQKGFRTQSEIVDFFRETDAIKERLDRIGFDEEDRNFLYNSMWSARVDTPFEAPRNRMRLSEYADELSKTDKPKQDDKPKQIVSPMEPTVKNVVYKPNSKGKTNESIIPAAMANDVKKALSEINGGDTDGFVLDKVGFKDKDEMYEALNAEQIDGVALAISAIERGEGLILGDMTGIGKGRQLAAVMRYARKEGIRPVFVTEKPGLFKDMMRDLLDVGADTPNKPFRPLIIASDSDGNVTLADGSTMKAADKVTIEKMLSGDLDKLAKGYDALFVTYANTNNVLPDTFMADQKTSVDEGTHNEKTETREPPELTKKKLNLIAKWAKGSIVVMDEAHNAAGTDSKQALQWREIIDTTTGINAKGVVMASATYAKTPRNYVLYALRTPIKEAHLSSSQLEDAFSKGGVPLQEWLAGQLTGKSYIRRERDMTGVNFDYKVCVDGYDAEHPENSTPEAMAKVKDIQKANDQAANIANTLLALDKEVNKAFMKIKAILDPKKGRPGAVTVLVQQKDGSYKEEVINGAGYPLGGRVKPTRSTFASRIAAINAQLFMAEKAESAADAAIKAIKEGELPMIVFENTFDSLMKDLPVDDNGVLESADYAQAFVRYLERLGNFTVKLPKRNANGKQEILNCRIDMSGHPAYGMVERMIKSDGVGLHVSPVDRIRERIEEAGYKVGELSGRKYSVQKLPDGRYHRTNRKTENPDAVTDQYNTGKIDVLLMNASGSTGRSMHEKGIKYDDGKIEPGRTQSGEEMVMKPRRQIYVQNFNNETTMVQAMGRIDRTGQVEHGRYTFLMTPVPAETNILMRAQRKREQLKANTTAQQDRNSFDAVNASDFINKYGDEVVAEFLSNNRKIMSALQLELGDLYKGDKAKPGLAKKATANAYTLTCEQQKEFYDEVQAAYDEYIKVLKENGDYDLETQVVDLQAETLAEHMFVRGSHESDSMFSQDTNIARCRVKVQRKPMKLEEIEEHTEEVLGEDGEKFQEKFDKHFADMEAEVIKEFEAKEQNVDNDGKKNEKLAKITLFKSAAKRVVDDFPIDLFMPFFTDTKDVEEGQGKIEDGTPIPHAIVYDVRLGRTLNSSTIVFAVNDGRQKVSVRMSDSRTLDYLRLLQRRTPNMEREDWNKTQGEAYEDAFIITGNLIGAYHGDIAKKGRMIRYTDSDGNVHTGILMPRSFKTKDVVIERPISELYNTLIEFSKRRSKVALPVFAGGRVEIEPVRNWMNALRFVIKGDLAETIEGDPDLAALARRVSGSAKSKPIKYEVVNYSNRVENSIMKFLNILASRYGISASVPIDPAYFMTREERDAEAEARMFRVEENIEERAETRFDPKMYVVHVPKERKKNVDATSDWLKETIREMNDKGLYGHVETSTTNENGKRVYNEFAFQNKAMAEEFVRMVNNEPVRPLTVDEKSETAEPNWEEVDRSQHNYQFARPTEQLIGADIAKTFGFRNVDTGNSSTDGVRDLYNAFMTMAMLLNIDPKSVSLGGLMDVNMLSGATASWELGPNTVAQFKLTGKQSSYTGRTQKKMQFRAESSAFPLAHEWLHALDNYFGSFGLRNEETGIWEQARYATENADREGRPWTARPEMREAWANLIRSLVESGFVGRLENEHFFKDSNFTDSPYRPQYWGERTEMLARAFEPYLRKKITENEDNLSLAGGQRMRDMIAHGNDNRHDQFDPTPKEQAVIDKAFDKLFDTIKEKRDIDTGRVIMYEQAKPGETKREATMRETRNLNRVLAKTGLANSVTVESEKDFAKGVFANTGRPLRTLDGIVYGYTDSDGNIHLNAKYLNFETPIHEYGHLWTAWAKKNHGDLWQRGIELAKESDAFKKLKEESKKKGSVYNGMTDDQLADEVLADAIGKKGQDMYDPKDWTRTARVRHWLTQLWHRIGEALGFRKRMPNMGVGDMSFDDIIRSAAGDILSGKRLKGSRGKGSVRAQFIGERGARNLDTAENGERMHNHAIAEEMERVGKSALAIKVTTGWERGTDGKWRYEEPDGDFVGRGINVADAEQRKLKLSDVWDSPELFKAYPEFADIPVEIVNNPLGASATTQVDRAFETSEFTASEKFIRDYDNWLENTKKRRDQYKERLSSSETSEEMRDMLTDIIKHMTKEIEDAPNRLEASKEVVAEPNKIVFMKVYLNKAHLSKDGVISADAEFSGNNARQVVAHEIQHLIQENEGFASGGTTRDMTYGQYRRLAGETEARNVSRRVDMPEYERRMSLASDTEDVPRERQTVRYTSKTNESNNSEVYTNLDGNKVYRETREDGTIDREITTMPDGSKMAEWFDENGHVREELRYYPNGEVSRVRNYDENGELTRQIDYDENGHIISHTDFSTDTHLERDENGVMQGTSNGVELKPYNFRFQQVAEPVKQAISSAGTSLNQVASGLRSAPLQPGTTNFDLGGGRFDKGTEYLAEKGVENVVFDPFNRDAEHNQRAFEIVKNGGFDSVTCNNVLNVIAEPEVRSNVILQAAKALKQGGTAYFTVYEGSGNGEGKETTKGWQNNRKTADYVDEIKQHFGSVERKGKLIIAKDPITDGKADWFMDAKQEEPIRFQAGSPIGNNEQLHIAREYAQDRTRTTTKLYEEVVENSVSLRHVLEDIAKKSGKPIADYENVYLAENQSHGMMTTELITFRDRRVNPLMDSLRKLAKNYGGEPTKNYVWARHGIERSIYVCFRERAYELAEKEAEAAAKLSGEEVTDKDINEAYNAMLDELYNATSAYSPRAYLENLEREATNILSAHGDTKPFEVTDKAGLTALNDKRSLVDDKPIENAWEIVKEYENNAGTEGEADVEALFDRLNDISKSMLDYSKDKGMMDKDTVEKIRKMFRFYVPLQGFAEGTMAQDYFEYMDSNPMRAGHAIPSTPKMRGRIGESADPIATLVRNAEMTIAAARRNTVATHLYNLATSRDTDLFAPARAWEAYDAAEDTWVPSTPDFTGCETTKDMMDAIRLHDEQMRQQRELGLAREARRGFSNRLITAQGAPKGLKMSMRQRHEHAVPVRINGKENVIYVLSDPRIAQIVNGTDKGSVDKNNAPFFYQANKLKRIQSGLMTSYNIAFWFANGARDIQNAFLRQAIMNGGGAAARTAAQGFKGDPLGIIPWEAMKLYNKAVKGTLDESNKHERYFKEFFEHGGITGYAFADQVEVIQSRVKKLLEHPKANPRRLMFAIGEMMEKAGGAFEIAPRFATYVASRDGGKSVMQAVADAKEATVNFDRRGARRSWLMRAAAAFYAFLNPGIQGMQNRLHQVRTNPGKTTLLHAAGFAMGYLWKGIAVACLASLGRKDDEYDTQLTEYDRRNNICIPVGDDDWVKIPIDMEDRVLFGLGDAVRNGMDFFPGNRYIGGEGKDDYDDNEDWMKYAGIVSAWFPIDVGSENNFIPTSLQPIYDIYINKKDFRGNAVDWRNERNAQDPEYQRVNPYVTGKSWTAASKWWSEFNGGNEVVRAQKRSMHGWDEINPQHMQYLFQSYLGGLGTTVGQVMSLVETLASDEPDKKYSSFKFPIANRFWKGNLNEYSATKDERTKARVWTNWADEIIRRDREYRKRGAEHNDENNTLSKSAREDYEDNLRYLQLAKEIKSQKDKKSNAKKKATKEGRKLTEDEEREFDNAMWERIPEFEQKFLDIDGKRKVPEWRKHYDDD